MIFIKIYKSASIHVSLFLKKLRYGSSPEISSKVSNSREYRRSNVPHINILEYLDIRFFKVTNIKFNTFCIYNLDYK